jgi:hypothetical protein
MMNKLLVFLSLFTVAGCTGRIIMSPADPTAIAGGGEIEGVLVTRPILAIEIDEYTQITIPGAKSVSAGQPLPVTVSGACSPVEVRKLVTIPDPNHLYRLHYEPGLLEAHSFGMTMDASGVLLSINSQSTPDAGKTLSALTGIAVSAQKMAGAHSGPAMLPPCTTGPNLVRFESAQSLTRSIQ